MNTACTPTGPSTAPGPRHWRQALLAGLLATALALTGCGPGVGGTGTGQEHGASDFGATATALCTSELAEQLGCPSSAGGGQPSAGSVPLLLADATPPQRATGRIDGNRIELTLRCEGWSFFGEWGVAMRLPGGRFYGTGRGPGGRVQPAVLELVAQAGGGFLATLQDSLERPLVPPLPLQVVGSLAGATACGL